MQGFNLNLFLALLLAHLIGDFWVQTNDMVEEKFKKHYGSPMLYVHTAVVSLLSLLLVFDWRFWPCAIVLFLSHSVLDGVKTYAPLSCLRAFLLDQFAHLLVIAGISCFADRAVEWIPSKWLLIAAVYVFCSTPANVLIKLIMKALEVMPEPKEGEENEDVIEHAGACIGTLERWLVLSFVLVGNYEAAGLVVAAKSMLRFTDKQGPKTEYVLIGTLISFTMSLACAFLLLTFAFQKNIFDGQPEVAVKVQCEHKSK